MAAAFLTAFANLKSSSLMPVDENHTAGPYHEFIEAAEAAIPVVGYLYHVSFYVRGQC